MQSWQLRKQSTMKVMRETSQRNCKRRIAVARSEKEWNFICQDPHKSTLHSDAQSLLRVLCIRAEEPTTLSAPVAYARRVSPAVWCGAGYSLAGRVFLAGGLRQIGTIRLLFFFFFQAEDGIRDDLVTGVQTCALPISGRYPNCAASTGPTSGPGPAMAAKWCPKTTHLLVGMKSRPLSRRSAGVARSGSSTSTLAEIKLL